MITHNVSTEQGGGTEVQDVCQVFEGRNVSEAGSPSCLCVKWISVWGKHRYEDLEERRGRENQSQTVARS